MDTEISSETSATIYTVCGKEVFLNVRGPVHRSTIQKGKSNKIQQCIIMHTVPDKVHQLHVHQPSTYEKPEAASAVLGS